LPSFSNILKIDESQQEIMEVPASSGFNHPNFELCEQFHSLISSPPLNKSKLVGVLWHTKLLRKVTITPEGHTSEDINRCIDMCVKRGDRIINMFFHSSDLLPGCTDYVKTKSDKARFMKCIRNCIEHLRVKHNAEFTTMREIREKLERN